MPIPGYETLMLPVLKLAAHGEANTAAAVARLAEDFALSEVERSELLPSGRQTRFANRVHWAKTYLTQARLIEATRRGFFKATPRGLKALADRVTRIDNDYLAQFPEFREFLERRTSPVPSQSAGSPSPSGNAATPEERIDLADALMAERLRADLLERIVTSTPAFFERLIIDLLIAMGYGGSRADAGERLGRTGDGGIDGTIKEDPLGLDVVYLQAKRYAPGNAVGIEKVREFAGALAERGANKGVLVTTSHFVSSAQPFAERIPQRLVLIDGETLTSLMVRYGVGVRTERTIDIKRLDLDYFEEHGEP